MKLCEMIHICLVRDATTDDIWDDEAHAYICEYLASINNNR